MSCRGARSWLLWGLLLCLWGLLLCDGTAGHTNLTTVINALVGSDVTLPCKLSTEMDISNTVFDWMMADDLEVFAYKKGQYYGHNLSGQNQQFVNRVQHFPDQLKHGNGSIVILNAKMEDSGMYCCYLFDHKEKYFVKLVVDTFPSPFVSIRNISAAEAVLWCEVPGASSRPEVEWQDGDEQQLMGEKPQVELRGDLYYTSLAITVSRTSTKPFFCVAKYPENGHTSKSWTYVPFYDTFPTPFVSIRNISAAEAVLWCEVPGASSRPEVEWQDGDEKQLEAAEPQRELRGDLHYTSLAITVSRTSTKPFFCVAKYPENGRTSKSWTYVPFYEKVGVETVLHFIIFFIGLFVGACMVLAVAYRKKIANLLQ